MNFFDKEEIDILSKYSGKLKTDDSQIIYNELQKTYQKVEFWASLVKKQIFNNGRIKITKKPTNQANVFDFYQWAKIYPTKEDFNNKILAYTISIEKNEKLVIKIDTVGLLDNNPLRKKYYQFRKENPITKDYNLKDFSGWDDLVNATIKDIKAFESFFIELKKILVLQPVVNTEMNVSENKKNMTMSLNQILYGPPGTGKTYNTINKAISIANPEFDLNKEREDIKTEYDRLVESGQIVFTTFHQSMSYEDFIEGIKPVMTEDEGELNYEVQNGIFKEICKAASEISEITVVDNFDDSWGKLIAIVKQHIADEKLVKIGSWDYGLSTKESLKYSSLNSPSQYTFTITKQNILDTYQNKQARPSGAFQKDMEDVVNYMKANLQLSDYREHNTPNQHSRKESNYVLIIDEINRGNVSQIFGELITLIEESKRLGNSEELKVTLPYSKKEFGVPSNLYIIGTMNTADRSVESLDTALRRRFCFEEMLPNLEVLNDKIIEGIELKKLLLTINKRVEILLDRDHTIGHSYFIDVKTEQDLRNTFKNNIIPLLQEYFYGDYEKIGMILGEMFFDIPEKYNKDVFANFPSQNYPESGSMLRLKVIDDTFNIIEALKILMKQDVSN